VAVSADLDDALSAEQSKRARDDRQNLHFAECEARHQERTQVFHDLDQSEEVAGQTDIDHAS
jgi:hypothetical protein